MSNFTFLTPNWPELCATAIEAEQNVNSAPRTSCFYTRRSLEIAVKWLYVNDSYLKKQSDICCGKQFPKRKEFKLWWQELFHVLFLVDAVLALC